MEGEEFEKYGLKEDILKALCEKGWEKPSPVQFPQSYQGRTYQPVPRMVRERQERM